MRRRLKRIYIYFCWFPTPKLKCVNSWLSVCNLHTFSKVRFRVLLFPARWILYEAVQSLRWQKPFKIFCDCTIIKAEVSSVAGGLHVREPRVPSPCLLTCRDRTIGLDLLWSFVSVRVFEVHPVGDVLQEPAGQTPCTDSCGNGRTHNVPCSGSLLLTGLRCWLSMSGWIVKSGYVTRGTWRRWLYCRSFGTFAF
jgi:hypothetical protein